ncbi:unnamed protein product [Fraxinus pennsylvanica]|uniref:VQ domain-containing protein n=1 Tax=Fraxinus pennsylvanica TaxID=56036 RepID=A0AAD2DIT5_9LAMI|nr:unnamed protein product [Fraxinus pennsylvanica]
MDSYRDDISLSSSTQFSSYQQREKKSEQFSSFHSALHSVRKPMQKPKIYIVDPVNFKELVQMLTAGSCESQPKRLQEVAPPPLNLSLPRKQPLVNPSAVPRKSSDNPGAVSPLGFSLSPATLAFCSSFLSSPSAVL